MTTLVNLFLKVIYWSDQYSFILEIDCLSKILFIVSPKSVSPLITGFGNTVKPTTNSTCKDKNITAYISGDGQKVSVQITDDITENVTEGSHIFHFYNQSHGISCKVNVLVIRNCEYYFIWHSLMIYYAFLSVAQLFHSGAYCVL